MSEKLRLRTELIFVSKGNKFETTDLVKSRLGYINFPMLLQYLISPRLAVELGPEIGYLLTAKLKSPGVDPLEVTGTYNEFDLGINGGIRYFLSDLASINLSYTHGFAKVRELTVFDVTAFPTGTADYFNRSFQLSLSYRLVKN